MNTAAFSDLIQKLINAGASADELHMWETVFPLMEPEDQRVLIDTFTEELRIRNNQTQGSDEK